MKGDVGMSVHEKEGEQEDNLIPTSLFMCYSAVLLFGTGGEILRILVNL